MRSRITLIFIIFMVLWLAVIGRAVYLQILPNQRLAQLQRRQFETTVTLQSRRGAISDQNGHELAVSVRAYSLFMDPKLVEHPRGASRRLASVLGQSAENIYKRIKQADSKRFVWIQRHLDPDIKDQITDMKIKGFGFIQESKRVYPNGPLLANVLGFVGQEGQGLDGLEARYDEQLRNRKRQVSFPRDARGRPLLINGQYFAENLDGADIQLTIDQEVQYVLERELAQAVRVHQADGAVGLVLDAKTSEIRAMAQVPTFDPNFPLASPANARRNRVITDAFEPGSLVKTFVIAGALADKKIQPNSKFDCEGGRLKVGGRTIHEAEVQEKFHTLTVSEILAFSSNVGMTKLAFDYGQTGVFDILKQFGFGQRTGVEFLGEGQGILPSPPWRPHHFANISFGQGMSATALQVASAYMAVANGGVLRTPVLVHSIRDIETGETQVFAASDIRRVVSKDVTDQLTLMLTAATGKGATGYNARVTGYPVAGKTGTAQKVRTDGRGYMPKGYISSFAGFVPANDPQFVIFVALDNPRKDYYAATTAAPVFSRVASFALRKAMIAPVFITENNLLPAPKVIPSLMSVRAESTVTKPQAEPTITERAAGDLAALGQANSATVPNLIGLDLREAYRKVHGGNVDLQIVGEGRVVKTTPGPSERLPADRKLTVFLQTRD